MKKSKFLFLTLVVLLFLGGCVTTPDGPQTEVVLRLEITGKYVTSSSVVIDYLITPVAPTDVRVEVLRAKEIVDDFKKIETLAYEATQVADLSVLPETGYIYKLQLYQRDELKDERYVGITTDKEDITYETKEYQGIVEIPEEIDIERVVVRNVDKVVPINDDGTFTIDVKEDQTSVVICDVPEYPIPLMSIAIPSETDESLESTQSGEEIEINSSTTAKSILALNPILATIDPESSKRIMEAIDACSYLPTLADLIERVNNGETGLDQQIEETVENALGEIIKYLNEHYPYPLEGETTTLSRSPVKLELPAITSESEIQYEDINIDLEKTTVEISQNGDYYEINPTIPGKFISVCAPSMLVKMNDQLTTEMVYNFRHDTSLGSYIDVQSELQVKILRNESIYEWIDIIGKLINLAVDSIVNFFTNDEADKILIPADRNGIYAFSSYGGVADIRELDMIDDDLWTVIQTIRSGEEFDPNELTGKWTEVNMFLSMLALNEVDLIINGVSMIFDISPICEVEEFQEGIVDTILMILINSLKEDIYFDSPDDLTEGENWKRLMTEMISNASSGVANLAAGLILNVGIKAIFKNALDYILVVPKLLSIASNASEVVARITTMTLIVSPRELLFIEVSGGEEPPNAPSNLQAQALSSSQIKLTWTDNSDNETGFKVERKLGTSGSWSEIKTVGANIRECTDSDLTPNTTYYYRVRAYNDYGNSDYSDEKAVTTLAEDATTTPLAPSDLRAQALSSSQIKLTWIDNSDNEEGFKVERRLGTTGSWSQINTVGANIKEYTDSGLNPNTTYYYRVRAYNSAGDSSYSNEANATTQPPSSPQVVGHYDTAEWAWDVHVKDNYAYVADDDNGLVIVDVSDPTDPKQVGHYDTADQSYGVYVKDNYAYVADFGNGLVIVDINNPTDPQEVGHYNTAEWAWDVYVKDNYAYVADGGNGLVIVNVSELENPQEVGHYDTKGYSYDVYIKGGHAYVADGGNGLVIVDINNPMAPQEVGHCDTAAKAYGVYVEGDYAYVADMENGLVIVDVSNPTKPQGVGHYGIIDWCGTTDFAWNVYIKDHYAYVANFRYGLLVVDVSNPTNPQEVGHCQTAGWAYSVYVEGDYAYVADSENGLVIIDVSCF